MNNEVTEPTIEGSYNYSSDLKVDGNNKVIGGKEAYSIKVVGNPVKQEKEIVGDNPISLKLVQDREQEER